MSRAEIGREDREIERQQREAEWEWRRLPAARRAFAAEDGKVAHKDWQAGLRQRESRRGRVEGTDYGVEYELAHPDGGKVRYDYVDLRAHRIVDLKAAVQGDKVADIAKAQERQRQRHLDAYKAKFGVDAEYHYAFHPSTRALFGTDNEKPRSRDGVRASDTSLTPEQQTARMERNVLRPRREAGGSRSDTTERTTDPERRRTERRTKA